MMTNARYATLMLLAVAAGAQPLKQHSALYPRGMTARALANKAAYPWAATLCEGIAARAKHWLDLSDDALWEMVFGPSITRSHMVWSSGYCPACKRPVPMYDWQIDAWRFPWKVRCPRCREFFPKNDFAKYYRSGLDEHGVFDPVRADRALLFNEEHAGAADPLRQFGVDDGEGYVAGGHRWRFIGAYLQYGQFRQLVLAGIENLAAAYVVTGDPAYAHKAGVLLDRLADVFPGFDFAEQGLVYERRRYGGGIAGYVTYSIDSAGEVQKLALAYDQVFESLRDDRALGAFLAAKAARYRLENPKAGFADIQRNIEQRILRDALARPIKIRTNYPGTEATLAILKTVLEWPANRAEVMADIDGIVAKSAAVDGLTGEKGLNGYATIGPRFLADFLELYARADAKLMPELIGRHPKLRETYRFFVETWCGRQYYPHSGDTGSFATRDTAYAGLSLPNGPAALLAQPGLPTSAHSFFWRMYQATGDAFYPQLSYLANGDKAEGLPYDPFAADPRAIENGVRAAIANSGTLPNPGSVNKQEWRIAILRSPRDPNAAVWLDYDSVPVSGVRGHYHYDAMNIGIYAKGLDLLPEFGYPAVQFGDWHTPQARWHFMTAAHNTVAVDGKNQSGGEGRTTLWADGTVFRAMRASSPEQIRGSVYERSVAMVDLPDRDFYVLDVFRVAGGSDHAKFLRSYFGTVSMEGLQLAPAADYGHDTLMRNFACQPAALPGWNATWKIEDRYHYLSEGADVRLRYTDLTRDAQACTAESWTVRGPTSTEEFWIPTIVTRRQGQGASTFASVLEPFERAPRIRAIRRLDREGEARVAIECTLDDGRKDLWTAADAGDMAFLRLRPGGEPELVAAAESEAASIGGLSLEFNRKIAFVEFAFEGGGATLVTGDPGDVRRVLRNGKRVPWRAR